MALPALPAPSSSGRKLVFRALLTAFLAAAAIVMAAAVPANAADTPAAIEQQIDKQWQQLEPVIENYNAVHAQFLKQKAKADALNRQILPLSLQVENALNRVSSYSVSVFENGPGGTLRTLLNADTSTQTLDMLGLMDQMAAQQQKQIAGTIKLQKKYQDQKKPIDALVSQLNTQQKQLDQQKDDINGKISQLNKLRLQAYGSTSGTGKLRPVACPQTYTGDAGSKAAKFACQQIGKPYVWAASGPGSYDCSGLTMRSWASVGVSLPHNAYQQKHSMPSVSHANLKVGDLIFYYPTVHHVAIYVGNGWMVNAPETGDVVRMAKYNAFPVVGYGRP